MADGFGGRVGRYVVHGEIASGGMATIYLASAVGSVGFSRTVALKRLHPQFARDADFVAMFIDEARIASKIHHPNVVATVDALTEGDELLVVMEYVHGETLSRLQRAGDRSDVPAPLAAAILVDVLSGLHAAHEVRDETGRSLGLVHRDVSPQNVLVGVDGVARITDFGIAKAEWRMQTTRDGQLKGKIGYMAAEQIAERTVDRRTDVFAASVVLWELLTGKRLFGGVEAAAVLRRILDGEVVAPSREIGGVSPDLDAVVLRGLARHPDDRFSTALEMADALSASVPLATPASVGEWVATHAARALEAREALRRTPSLRPPPLIDEPTAQEAPATAEVVASSEPAPVRALPRRQLALGAALVVAGGITATFFWPPTAKPETLSERIAYVVPRTAPEAPSSAAATTASPEPGASVEAPPSPTRTAARSVKPGVRRPGCQPPYSVGPDGVHRWKPECLP